jgi:hypothetical protein
MALLLPVVPTAGLKAAVLGAVGIGASAGAGAGGGSLAGLGAAKGLAAKTMLCAAVAGGAGSAGYVAVHEVQMHDARGDVPAVASRASHRAQSNATRGPQAARAAKRIVISRSAAPVAAAPKPSHAAGADGARHGKRHRHDGFRRDGSRRAAPRDGHERRGDSRGHGGRDGGQPDRFGRGDSAQRGSQRGDSAQRRDSGRGGSAQRGGSTARDRSTPRERSQSGGTRIRTGARGGSRPGAED